MQTILAQCSASISELKQNPTALLDRAQGSPIVILNHNKPTAYLIPAKTYSSLMDLIEDNDLANMIKERLEERNNAVKVSL
jgi:antitoxin StbD